MLRRIMRTTLTLEADVAALLKQAMGRSKKSLKAQVNEALRLGLTIAAKSTGARRRRSLTHSHDGGRALISLECVSEALAIAEGESFR